MRIVVETPKYSFSKYRKEGSQFIKEFISPIPTLFNYGFIDGSLNEDGMEIDVIIIGPVMKQGDFMERSCFDGIVRFVDDSLRDDKHIIYLEGFFSKTFFSFYFRLYALFKSVIYLFSRKGLCMCRFEGIELYESGVDGQ